MALIIKYFIIAFSIALTVVLFNVFSATGEIRSFGQGMGYLFWMTLGPGAGMSIGAALRQWLMPDAVYTSEGMTGLMKARLFWLVGPQSIGWLAGLMMVGKQLM
ncbi:TPA: hypothetical protein QIF84_004020 [Klebsiella aerogenes]|uniref:hypothetical protein n=1 Tax=Klebsiella aerogenes TaxID=548 RepID=UPI00115CF70E|nr:hypothetical protein [Klebsiella aerogenes]ELA2606777.1 hypothetical protein [Klebsiella aerogenes]EMC9823419.1 hypothetical protein [Klebsiella aerogenes]MDU9142585.1 hypothetical protein [Klebsiella aerogenes]HBR6855983.1 hypothetical protein [Klebsiella aerogenes]HBR6988391.1 hypothetical protein [Klebsiella aerogenes]